MEKAALQASLNTLDVWLIIFGILVAIGAVGGSVAGYLHLRRSGQLQTVLEAENLAQQKEIANANATAAQAEQRAAEANLELARMKAPRSLSQEQQARIVASLNKYSGTIFDVGTPQDDPEVFRFEMQVESVLRQSGWRQIDWIGGDVVLTHPDGRPNTGLVAARDITAGAYPEKAATLGVVAAALAEALNSEGIKAATQPAGEAFINKNRDAVHIVIGRKT